MTRAQDPERAQLAPSSEGSVMLDLGGDIGALVLHTGPDLLLAEIEVSRVDCGYPLAPGYQLPHQHHLEPEHGEHGHQHAEHDHEHGHGEHGHQHADHDHQHADHDHQHADHDHQHAEHGAAAGGEDVALRTHVAVRERHVADGVRYAAIFAGLLAGEYRLWNPDGSPGDTVTIVGGRVTEHTWR